MKESIKKSIKQLVSLKRNEEKLIYLKERKIQEIERLTILESEIEDIGQYIQKLNKKSFYVMYLQMMDKHEDLLEMQKEAFFNLAVEYRELELSILLIEKDVKHIEGLLTEMNELKVELRNKISASTELEDDQDFKELHNLTNQIQEQIELIQEFEEAVKAGEVVNRRINAVIRHVKKCVYWNDRIVRRVLSSESEYLKYHSLIIAVRHELLKFQKEVSDVYKLILKTKHPNQKSDYGFVDDYRKALLKDLKKSEDMVYSAQMLLEYKEVFLSITRNLRKDRKSLEKRLNKLEQQELHLLSKTH